MALKVKVCGMRDPENISAVADLSPEFMGFIFYPGSPRYAGETLKPEDIDGIPETIKRVGVFVNEDIDRIKRLISFYSLHYVQLHGEETPEICYLLKKSGIGVIKAFNIRRSDDFLLCRNYTGCTDWLLFDAASVKYGGSGTKFDWKMINSYNLNHPFFLSGGIGEGDLQEIQNFQNNSFYGVDLNSRFEIKPGLKDIVKLKNLISGLRK